MKKKIVAMMMIAAMAVGLAACGNTGGQESRALLPRRRRIPGTPQRKIR